jgi:hypothetical protein
VVAQWPDLAHVIADGGTGLEQGVQLVKERRQSQAQERDVEPSPAITMGLDGLHTQRERERVWPRQWTQAERPLEMASEADAKGAQDKRRGRAARGGAGSAGRAWRKAERLFAEAVQAAEAGKQAETALGWCAAEGHLRSRGEAQEPLEKASEKLSGSLWSKVRRLLKAERTLRHRDRIAKPRAEVVPELMRRASLTR